MNLVKYLASCLLTKYAKITQYPTSIKSIRKTEWQSTLLLSPLLFAIAIEPLAAALRSSQVQGIIRGGVEHKLTLYADDLLLFISDPDRSLPAVTTIVTEFSQISGYKLNFSKSELMPVNNAAKNYSFTTLPFKIALESFKYLGVCVTKHHSDLFRYNFTPLLKQITDDLDRWSILPLSLAGRINCVKMNECCKTWYKSFQNVHLQSKF